MIALHIGGGAMIGLPTFANAPEATTRARTDAGSALRIGPV